MFRSSIRYLKSGDSEREGSLAAIWNDIASFTAALQIRLRTPKSRTEDQKIRLAIRVCQRDSKLLHPLLEVDIGSRLICPVSEPRTLMHSKMPNCREGKVIIGIMTIDSMRIWNIIRLVLCILLFMHFAEISYKILIQSVSVREARRTCHE